ncbi:MAG: nucleotidyltransferase domain-containing protein [Candidatus Calditenuis sp.]|nr:nucleotidyltransferase domain-containing protein [Candidatus Calditenuis sp.]
MGEEEREPALIEQLKGVKLSEKRKRELARFLKRLKRELGVVEVYIFGSRAYGNPLLESDLDMIVVSEEFGKRSFIENMELLSRMWDGSFTVEMFPYTPEQLRKYAERKTVVSEALRKGIRIRL